MDLVLLMTLENGGTDIICVAVRPVDLLPGKFRSTISIVTGVACGCAWFEMGDWWY